VLDWKCSHPSYLSGDLLGAHVAHAGMIVFWTDAMYVFADDLFGTATSIMSIPVLALTNPTDGPPHLTLLCGMNEYQCSAIRATCASRLVSDEGHFDHGRAAVLQCIPIQRRNPAGDQCRD
jgi:hypothetical protein